MPKIYRQPIIRQPLPKIAVKKRTPSPFKSPFKSLLPLTCLAVLSSCGVLPTRNSVSTAERLIPVDKILTPFELLFRGEIFAALVSLPLVPFVEIGELFSDRSIFPPAFSPDEWKSPYSGPYAGQLYNASQVERDKAAKK